MEDPTGKLEREVSNLAARLAELEQRVDALRADLLREKVLPPAGPGPEGREYAVVAPAPVGSVDAPGMLALAGRLFIIMGGGYLLRAFAETSVLSPSVGISLGLGYALFWVVAAGRAAGNERRPSGVFHGIAASLIAFPLLWESVTRFRIVHAPLDSCIAAVLTTVFLLVAVRYRFQALAWLTVVAASVTTLALLPDSESMVPGVIFLILLGVATLWLGYELEWKGLRWLAAFAANLAVLALTLTALPRHPRVLAAQALFVQLLMLGLYLASIAVRTLVRERNVIPFEVFQAVAAFLLGFLGAVFTTRATGIGSDVLGGAALVLGFSCYAVSFAFVDKLAGHGRNFYFYTSLALLFVLTGTVLLLHEPALELALVAVAGSLSWLSWHHSRLVLALQATICMIVAAIHSGALSYAVVSLVGPAALAGSAPTAAQIIVFAGAAVCIAWPVPAHPDVPPPWVRVQRLILTVMLVLGIGAGLTSAVGRAAGALPSGGLDAGILATIRTIVLAIAALGLAWMGERERFREWGWLHYPVIAGIGLKLLFEDLPNSRPATLFAALAAYGCVLTLSPRVRRKFR